MKKLLIFIPLFIFADKYTDMYDKCLSEAETMNNMVVYACSDYVSETVSKEMNKIYDIIYQNISTKSNEDAKKFELSQKSWISYRDEHYNFMGNYVGTPMYSSCPMKLNIDRLYELKELQEGL